MECSLFSPLAVLKAHLLAADKELARELVARGAGEQHNATALTKIMEACSSDSEEKPASSLDLSKLLMTSLPDQIRTLAPSLTELDLTRNDLTMLPEALFELTLLTSLTLTDNHLFVLPSSINKLGRLQQLKLSQNRLEKLPVQLAELEYLQTLEVDLNPLVYPPPAVVKRGMAAILGHMRDGLVSGTVTNHKVKVVLMGDSEAGKTSFLKTLIAAARSFSALATALSGSS